MASISARGAEEHVEDTGYGESDVVADGIGVDALAGDLVEACVELGRGVVVEVVVVEERVGSGRTAPESRRRGWGGSVIWMASES